MAKRKIIDIDGTTLEGGGQLVRIALGLSALTGVPIRISNIRGNRPKGGGLKQQHLSAASWLGQCCSAEMYGVENKSKDLEFIPSPTPRSDVPWPTVIDIGSAGSTSLVFQAVLPFLLFHHRSLPSHSSTPSSTPPEPIHLTIHGGTHTPLSPTHDYLTHVLLPTLHRLGLPKIHTHCPARGWSNGPITIGRVTFTVPPLPAGVALAPFRLARRGRIARLEARALLPPGCAAQFRDALAAAQGALPDCEGAETVVEVADSGHARRGYFLLVAVCEDGHRLGRDGLWERKVADAHAAVRGLVERVVREMGRELAHGACVDGYMRDQLVVFQALAGGGSRVEVGRSGEGVMVARSLHVETAEWIAGKLLGAEFDGQGGCEGVEYVVGGGFLKRRRELVLDITEGVAEVGLEDESAVDG